VTTRAELEAENRRLAKLLEDYLAERHGKRVGFTLFVFEFGAKGNLAYISNAQREDMITAAKEWLARLEAGLNTDPPGPRAEG
jgi:hypothetical protein